jgi:nitrate/TMAO reductase-like tetraheme cytochrome c subunit
MLVEHAQSRWLWSAAETHDFLSLVAGDKYTCIDCHKGIAHRLPNMEGIEMLYGAPLGQVTEQREP